MNVVKVWMTAANLLTASTRKVAISVSVWRAMKEMAKCAQPHKWK